MAINLRKAMLYDLSIVVVVVVVIVFSSHFLKENLVSVVPVWEVWDVLVQKLYLGVKKMCKKFREIPIVGLDLCCGTNFTTPPNLPSGNSAPRIYSIVKTTWTS